MSNLGLGVMINMLCGDGGKTAKCLSRAVGQTIKSVSLVDNALRFEMEDGFAFKLFDGGQDCCETRYMSTDDELAYYVGAELWDVEVREAPSQKDPESYEEHDVEFLVVKTNKGDFVMANHNEHNGYYGGFSVQAVEIKPAKSGG